MPQLTTLKIDHLRNLTDVVLTLGPGFNIFYGDNGSGKTSLLEAIHYLGLGRSFRTRQHNRAINHNQDQCVIFGKVQHDNMLLPLGLTRHKNGDAQLHLSGSPTQLNVIADLLPLQLIHPDGHKLISGGPKYRRQYLDWGVFHVEQSFYVHWQQAQRSIQQRNKHLKSGVRTYRELLIWDQALTKCAELIHQARQRYVEQLTPVLFHTFGNMSLNIELDLSYQPGWPAEHPIAEALERNFRRDQKLGHTSCGPHKADLLLRVEGKPAHEVLSQGQQKMLVYALKLSQAQLLFELRQKPSIFLIDDLPAELDAERRASLTRLLADHTCQAFITGIDPSSLNPFIEYSESKLFHVEHGTIEEA